jgi:rhamnosyltransferase
MNENVLACITAYYPGPEFENICSIISQQSGFLLIIDNSPECTVNSAGFTLPNNSRVFCNKNKNAISGAFNIALNYARENGYEFLNIFDQDTIPPPGVTTALIHTLKANAKAALVSPRFINSSTNFPGRVLTSPSKWRVTSIWPKADIGVLKVLLTISSASLIAMNRLPENAFYDNRLIIDGCDIDFCLYLRNAGLDILVDTSICIFHGIGSRKKGGSRWSATNYSPLRKQLSAKNRMIIWRRYWESYPGYILNDTFVFFLDSSRTVVFEKDRVRKLAALIKGLWQGLREKNISTRIGG